MSLNRTLTLDELPHAFGEARGNDDDRSWAQLVIGRCYLDNVNRRLVARELSSVLELVRASGESPEELFGEALDYVDSQIAQWRADGEPLEPVEPTTSWRDVPVIAAVTATVTMAVILVLELFAGNWTTDYTLGKLLMPLITGLAGAVALAAFESLLLRTRRLWAVTGVVMIVATSAVLISSLFILGNDRPLFYGPLWWFAVFVAVHALLAVAVGRFFPDGERVRRQRGRETEPAADDEWARQLAGTLRLRLEMPENQVQATIVEARQLATTRGTTLHEEFGTPGEYAARLPRSTTGKRTRELWRRTAWILAIPAFGYLAFEGLQDGLEWGHVRWLMALPFVAACVTVVGFIGKPIPARP